MRRLILIAAVALAAVPQVARAHEFVAWFDYGSASLSTRGYTMAAEVAAYAKREPSCVIIRSHLDTLEAVEFSTELSARRAQAVATELATLGVAPNTIRMIRHGAEQLARPTPPRTAEPLNRRAVVDVVYQADCTPR